jgi:hypothetical protein
MRARALVAITLAGACLGTACTKDSGSRTEARRDAPAGQPAAGPPPATTSAPTSARPARDVCALLPIQEAAEITSLPIERVEKVPGGCAWYASAAARRDKGVADAAGTIQKLTKQEPASADEGARDMETILKGLVGAASPAGPLFAVSVQSEGADQAEAVVKGTIAVVGGGQPGGSLEPVAGLGDRAYFGPAGSFLYVRTGPAWMEMDLRAFSGTREQALALARRLVARL